MRARRLAPVLAAALLLSACSVDVEGAPCRTAWQDDGDCPGGQACGNDLRCSTRAFACLPSTGSHCAPGDRAQDACLDAGRSRYCTDADPVCGTWVVEDCAGSGMVCGLRGTSNRCECPDPQVGTSVLVADATHGSPDAGTLPFPRGVGPPRCRFGNLWDALDWTTIVFGVGDATVTGAGTFVRADRNRWPLRIGANTRLVAAPGAAPVILGDPEGVSSTDSSAALIVLQGVLDGFRVAGGGPSTFAGVRLRCGPGVPELRNASIDGAGSLEFGVVVGGLLGAGTACGGRVVGTAVTGTGTALSLEPEAWGTANVLGGAFTASHEGIRVRRGTMTVDPDPATSTTKVRVAGNAGPGVILENAFSATVFDATLRGLDVSGNAGAGIVASGNPFPAAAKVRIRETDVHGNGKTGAAGGIRLPALATSMSLLELSGSRVWSNGGDQLTVFASPTVSAVGVDACGPTSNWLGCAGSGVSVSNTGSPWLDVYGTVFTGYSGNVRSAGTACTGAEPGFPAAPTCE